MMDAGLTVKDYALVMTWGKQVGGGGRGSGEGRREVPEPMELKRGIIK